MRKFKTFFANHWQLLFWPLFASLLFIPTCGTYTVLPSPDSAPFYPRTYLMDRFVNLLAESPSLSLDDVLEFVLPPLFRHDFSYWLSVVATALGGYWLMRERNAPKSTSAFAGGAFAFAGYSFTLISAGHRAYFTMTPYVVATFAFLVHAVRRQNLLAYALAAATAAWAFRFGPDVGPQFLVVAALYAIWLFATNSVAKPLRERTRPFLLGVGCALLSFALVASPSIVHTLTETLAWRQKQIEQSSGTALTSAGSEAGGEAEEKIKGTEAAQNDDEAAKAQEKWIFATNWSLPPEETIEFIAPSIFGTWTGDRNHPYWGRLGRSAGWDAAHPDRGGFFNFRQHIVYLGAIPLAQSRSRSHSSPPPLTSPRVASPQRTRPRSKTLISRTFPSGLPSASSRYFSPSVATRRSTASSTRYRTCRICAPPSSSCASLNSPLQFSRAPASRR